MHGAVLVAKHRKSGRRVAAKCLEEPDTNTLPEEVRSLSGHEQKDTRQHELQCWNRFAEPKVHVPLFLC